MEDLEEHFSTKAKQMSQINSLTKDGKSYSTPEEISNVLNEHFISIADNIIDNTINAEPDLTLIDLRKAFNVVDHKLLLKKLQVYGLNTNSLEWFQSYLSGRYQKVCVDSKLSEPLGIHSASKYSWSCSFSALHKI